MNLEIPRVCDWLGPVKSPEKKNLDKEFSLDLENFLSKVRAARREGWCLPADQLSSPLSLNGSLFKPCQSKEIYLGSPRGRPWQSISRLLL